MKNCSTRGTADPEDPFRSVDFGGFGKFLELGLQLLHIKGLFKPERKRPDLRVVASLHLIEKFWVYSQLSIKVERLQVQKLLQIYPCLFCPENAGMRIQCLNFRLNVSQTGVVNEVHLVQE